MDIMISKQEWMKISVCRKPTIADCITLSNSCHPSELKLAAIRYLQNGVYVYSGYLKVEKKMQVIRKALHNKATLISSICKY